MESRTGALESARRYLSREVAGSIPAVLRRTNQNKRKRLCPSPRYNVGGKFTNFSFYYYHASFAHFQIVPIRTN
jgi:hypothetical protein